jgi:small multidrug resistance pump
LEIEIMKTWIFLAVAICAEVIATTSLKYADGFTKLVPSIVVIVGYGISLFLLSLVLKTIPVAIASAIWSGLGLSLTVIVSWIWLGQKLDWGAILGIGLIISGVIAILLFSKTITQT